MKGLVFCFLVGLMGVSFGGIEEVLVEEYEVYRKQKIESFNRLYPRYPVIENGPSYTDGEKRYRGFSLDVVIRMCIEDGKIDAEEFARGLFHRKDFVRHTCVGLVFDLLGEELDLKTYPKGMNVMSDPFSNDVVWENQCELRMRVSAAWPELSKKALLNFNSVRGVYEMKRGTWGKANWRDLPLRVVTPPLR